MDSIIGKPDKPSYPSLYGLRALSIILVLFHHFGFPEIPAGLQWASHVIGLLHDGQLGVNIFFVISGFLITSLLLQEEAASGKVSIGAFYLRRTLRIFPAYYFLLLVYWLLQLQGIITIKEDAWITALTYTKDFNWSNEHYTPHAWSLSIEEQFYLFWPLVFIYGRRIRRWVIVALIIAVPLVRLYDYFVDIPWINDLSFFERIDAIALGCLLAFYKDEIVKSLSRHWTLAFYAAIVVLICTTFEPSQSLHFYRYAPFAALGSAHGTIANFAVATIVMYSVFGPRRAWFKLLNLKPVAYIGLLSYSIYLWQQFFAVNSDYWFTNQPWEIGGVFAAALFSYYVIERPFLKLKKRFTKLRISRRSNPELTGIIE